VEKLLREKGLWMVTAVVCAGAALALLCVMTLGEGHVRREPITDRLEQVETVPRGTTLALSEEQLEALLLAAVPDDLGLRNLKLTVGEGELSLSADAEKSRLLALIQQANPNAGTFLHTAAALLPEKLPLGAALGIAMEEETLRLTPKSLTLGEMTLPVELLPRQLTAPLQQALSAAAESAGGAILDVTLSAGVITVTLE